MTEQELSQNIAKLIVRIIKADRAGHQTEIDAVSQLRILFKQANYVQLSPDQSLPSVRNAVNKSYNDYMLGQEDMLNDKFRRVE